MPHQTSRAALRAPAPTLEPDEAFLARLSALAASGAPESSVGSTVVSRRPATGMALLAAASVALLMVGIAWLTGLGGSDSPGPSPQPSPGTWPSSPLTEGATPGRTPPSGTTGGPGVSTRGSTGASTGAPTAASEAGPAGPAYGAGLPSAGAPGGQSTTGASAAGSAGASPSATTGTGPVLRLRPWAGWSHPTVSRHADDEVVSRAKRGDTEAWRALYRDHAGRLLIWLGTRPTGDAAITAEDVLAETWLVAAERIHDFTGSSDEFAG